MEKAGSSLIRGPQTGPLMSALKPPSGLRSRARSAAHPPPHASGRPGSLLGFRCPLAGGSGPQDSRPALFCPESLCADRLSLRFCP